MTTKDEKGRTVGLHETGKEVQGHTMGETKDGIAIGGEPHVRTIQSDANIEFRQDDGQRDKTEIIGRNGAREVRSAVMPDTRKERIVFPF